MEEYNEYFGANNESSNDVNVTNNHSNESNINLNDTTNDTQKIDALKNDAQENDIQGNDIEDSDNNSDKIVKPSGYSIAGSESSIETDGNTENTGFILIPEKEDAEEHLADKQRTDSNSADPSQSLKDASFYTENYRKRPHKKSKTLLQFALVSVVSAFIGAFTFAALLLFVPKASPAVRDYLQEITGGYVNTSGIRELSVDKTLEVIGESNLVAEIAEAVGPTVVGVKVTYQTQGGFLFGSRQDEGVGSGVIIRDDGYIMTNYHVIQSALNLSTNEIDKGSKIEIILPNRNNKPYTAKYIGGDYKTDLAVLKISEKNLPVAKMGDSDKIRVGELAVAIGNPGGLELAGSVTSGVISGINRTLPLDDGTQLQLIQTDAAISPGNSGGALVNSKGEIIGVNRLKIVGADVEGLGFAIPINKVREITNSLIESGYVKGRPWLGITAHPQYTKEIADMWDTPFGVYVKEVHIMSGASKAGIEPHDIITKFNGERVYTVDEINAIKDKFKPGDTVTVEVYRDGKYKTLKVTLTEAKF